MTRLFTGDCTTKDLSQWYRVVSSGQKSVAAGLMNNDPIDYAALQDTTVNVVPMDDPDAGYAVKFTLTDNDNFPAEGSSPSPGNQKAQLAVGDVLFYAGETHWIAWSAKFDTGFDTYPVGRASRDFLIFGEDNHGTYPGHPAYPLPGGTTMFWGAPYWSGPLDDQEPGTPEGYWSLGIDKYGDGTLEDNSGFLGRELILTLPLVTDVWYDIKMQIKFSPSDSVGFVRCWVNNVAQTMSSGTTTWTGRTTPGIPASGEWFYAMNGIYRSGTASISYPWDDMTMRMANYRIADSEASL